MKKEAVDTNAFMKLVSGKFRSIPQIWILDITLQYIFFIYFIFRILFLVKKVPVFGSSSISDEGSPILFFLTLDVASFITFQSDLKLYCCCKKKIINTVEYLIWSFFDMVKWIVENWFFSKYEFVNGSTSTWSNHYSKVERKDGMKLLFDLFHSNICCKGSQRDNLHKCMGWRKSIIWLQKPNFKLKTCWTSY